MQNTFVLSTSRAIRARVMESTKENSFLPSYFSMSEFLSRIILVDKKILTDNDQRVLFLLEASKFTRFDKLNIDRNFYSFIKNSQYIFKFFEELSGELIDIHTLVLADTYGDYEEHITILIELYTRYKEVCDNKNCIDVIFIKQEYELNTDYINSLKSVMIEVEGYVTNFEFQLLQSCTQYTDITLKFFASKYNAKLQSRFNKITLNAYNTIDLKSMKLLECECSSEAMDVKVHAFSERLSQVAFVKQKIYEYINSGIRAENIVVILPDEGFAEFLHMYDDKHNLNFAMGISLKDSYSLKVLQAGCDYLENASVQNQQRLTRYEFYGIELLQENYYETVTPELFDYLIEYYLVAEHNNSIKKIIKEELFNFLKIMPELHTLNLKSLLHLFLKRCYARSIDDVRGGKVTVMGVLETRGIHFEGVIVVDFNEDVVPHKSEKDLFLNSITRKHAKLPTSEDRENLQKHYYYMLFLHAKRVELSYVMSDIAKPSRFLMQLGITPNKYLQDINYMNILYDTYQNKKIEIYDKEVSFDFSKHTFSASGLKSYLQCKKQFYYRYVEKLRAHEIISDMPKEHAIGNTLHDALKVLYSTQKSYHDIKLLKKDFQNALYNVSGSSSLEKFQLKLWQKKLMPFFENEINRFKKNIEVYACEESLTTLYRGIKLSGKIDRIDIVEGKYLQVIDYKSGSYPTYSTKTLDKASDFQLEFYKILVQNNFEYNVDALGGCFYYDLKSGALVNEVLLDLKIEKLHEHLDVLKEQKIFVNEKCDDLSHCTFCEFTYLCVRV